MKLTINLLISLCALRFLIHESFCQNVVSTLTNKEGKNSWQLGHFTKVDSVNPILKPDSLPEFYCPIKKEKVRWQEKDVFNPAAIVRNGKVYLLFRAEDKFDKGMGTSRIGLAESADGLHFKRRNDPVLFPDKDNQEKFEWEGGCEDPRIVEAPDGTYYMYYASWNGELTHLNVASSNDLIH